MTKGKRAEERDEEARKRLADALAEVGENLPDDVHGVEGADVGNVLRHRRKRSEGRD